MRLVPIISFSCLLGISGFLWRCNTPLSQWNTPENLSSLIDTSGTTIETRVSVPDGYVRMKEDTTSFGYFLRHLDLKPHGSPVLLYDGRLKSNQTAHVAVIRMSVGNKDLQQCADAVMRLRAEYLYQAHEYNAIHFSFTNGFTADYSKWRAGNRIRVNGNQITWSKTTQPDTSYDSFLKYLEVVFSYAGTLSLASELKSAQLPEVAIGNVLIKGGAPGHAVLVVDVAEHPVTHKKVVLLAQSYMPAQEIQLLKNPMNPALSPWFNLEEADKIYTPEWTFEKHQLKRF